MDDYIGANSLGDSALTYNAMALQVSRVRIQIPPRLSPTSFPVCSTLSLKTLNIKRMTDYLVLLGIIS